VNSSDKEEKSIIVIDACAIEPLIKSKEFLENFLKNKYILVFGKRVQMREYSDRLRALKQEGKERIVRAFIRLMRSAYTFIDEESNENYFTFEFLGVEPKVKDIHLFRIAKKGALLLEKDYAKIITVARDVLRVKKAINGRNIAVYVEDATNYH